jgi:hypothetical protein
VQTRLGLFVECVLRRSLLSVWPAVATLVPSRILLRTPVASPAVPSRTASPSPSAPATVRIFKPPAMVNPGVYRKPIPFGGMGKPVNQNGFSDHFPITMAVNETD